VSRLQSRGSRWRNCSIWRRASSWDQAGKQLVWNSYHREPAPASSTVPRRRGWPSYPCQALRSRKGNSGLHLSPASLGSHPTPKSGNGKLEEGIGNKEQEEETENGGREGREWRTGNRLRHTDSREQVTGRDVFLVPWLGRVPRSQFPLPGSLFPSLWRQQL
jgi:hypothetical protein